MGALPPIFTPPTSSGLVGRLLAMFDAPVLLGLVVRGLRLRHWSFVDARSVSILPCAAGSVNLPPGSSFRGSSQELLALGYARQIAEGNH